MNYGNIKECDIADGPGVRVSLFVSGCRHHCKGCFNEETWNFNYGQPYTEETEAEILNSLDSNFIQGFTLLGGEPFEPENQVELVKLLKKVREIKSKLFKSKNKDNSTLKTIDIRLIISIIDGASQAYFDIMNNAPSELEYDSDKSPEELNKVITKFQQYKFPSLDDIKMKLKVPEDINKTQIKITKKEIEKIFKESEKRLIKEDLTDIDGYISGLKNIYNEVEKTNEATYSDEQMVSFIKWHKVLLSHETALCTILNSITSLRNQYVSKALSYFDKYLKNHNEVSDKDIEISNDFKEAVDNGKVLRVHIMLADSMIIDPTFRDLNTELKYASKMNGLFDEHDGEKFEEDSDKWDTDYLNTIMVELKGNFSRERLEHTKKVVRKLIPIEGDNNQKKR